MTDTAQGLYLYAVARPAPDDPGTGVDGAPLEVVTVGGLSAVVHRHSGGPYSGPDDDVRRWVVEHSDVVDRWWQDGAAVLPVSFNVIVAGNADESARERLEAWLTTHADRLSARLDQLAGCVELQVEVGLDQREAGGSDPRAESMRAELEDKPAGVRRLLARRLEQVERDATDALANELYPEVRRRLAAVAREVTENRRAHPDPGVVPVLTVALLVERDAVDRVGLELTRLRDEHPATRIRYLGPWPPYSFAEMPSEPSAD